MSPGDWAWSADQRKIYRVVEAHTLWGKTVYRVWLPTQDAVVRVRAEQLQPLDSPHYRALRT